MKPLTPILLFFFTTVPTVHAAENERTFRVTGLFDPQQTVALRSVFADLPELELVGVDYERGEATIRFDDRFKAEGDSEKQRTAISERLRGATRGVFDVLPPVATPREQLQKIVIPVAGLDCRGCSYAASLAVDNHDGVARTTADFGAGRVTVWIDPDKITLADLHAALVKKRITLNYRIAEPNLVPADEMSVARVSSEEPRYKGASANAIDGDPQTIWQSRFAGEVAQPPHELVIDLGRRRKITGFRYLARQQHDVGQFAKTEFYVSNDAASFDNQPAAKATFQAVKSAQSANCPKPVSGRYVLVRVLTETNGNPNATAAEIGIVQSSR